MSDLVSIIINEQVNNVSIVPSVANEVIDINVFGVTEEVTIDVTPNVVLVNVNKVILPNSFVTSVNGVAGDVVLTKSSFGLSNVDNTSDANKPISSATQTALNLKENTFASGLSTQYFRGDKTWATLPIYTLESLGGQPLNANLTQISVLSGNGFLKKVNGSYVFDANTYLTSIASNDVIGALGYTPYSASNPSGFISGITSQMVISALGYTPYNATNPNNYLTSVGISNINATGTPSSTTYLRGDGTWATVSGGGGIGTETDPIYTASSWYTTTNNSSNWNTAYGWGNHASAGYIKGITSQLVTTALGYIPYNATNPNGYISSYTETDPTVGSHIKAITTTNISNWNSAFGWGNHALAGYLTSYTETDTLSSVVARGATTSNAITITNATDSSSTSTGALIISGGIGVLKNAHIGGNLTIDGNFTVSGTSTTVNTTNLSVTDSLIYLSSNQFTTDILDIGIYGAYGDGVTSHKHTGLVRDASDAKWKLISNGAEPISNVVDFSTANYDTLIVGSIVKNGGTSSQFLKADGSVDSSTYLTGITSGQVTTALGYTPYDSTNPNGYLSSITSGLVTTALGYTPQTQLNGTGFVKANGTTISYDNSTYLTGITSQLVTTALGYTPYNSTNPNGYTSNVGTVTSVSALTIATTGTDITSSVATSTSTPVITLNIPTASATNRGALSSADWSTFNSKQGALTLTTTGTSGVATLVGNTLNIPNYAISGGSFDGVLNAGTATTAPLDFTVSGSVLKTSSVAGDMEVDSEGILYYSHADVSEGVIHAEQFIASSGTRTLTSQTASQKIFATPTNGAVTVKASTTYYFECFFSLSSMSSTSGSFGFALAGTATFTSLNWTSMAIKATTGATAGTLQTTFNTTSANTTIVSASTQTGGSARITGTIRVNAGGTIIPSVSLGVASSAVVGANSYFRIIPIGTNTVTSVGNWS